MNTTTTSSTPAQLKEAALLARARVAILEMDDWLTAIQVVELANSNTINPIVQLNERKHDGLMFSSPYIRSHD